ncbi:MAG: putative DNA binding domain-containing protein [Chloroflexota bacterium]|nr:putative DNA binding domain-containing protein [Chloroflexota bacterium]MDE2920971.1 putative DNA binding domain-containing protein [Chloroflexota bacterium]
MTYSNEEITRRLQLGEDSAWEFKQVEFAGDRPRSPRRDDLADEIAAFANADGGTLLCGVTDDGEVQGMTRDQLAAFDAFVVEISSDAIEPPVRVHTRHMRRQDGKRLLIVRVPASDSLHERSGRSYIRVGGSKRRMTSDERLRLAQRRGQARFASFDEQAVPNTGFNTLDESLWRPLLSAEGAAEPEAALGRLALLVSDEAGIPRATVAGLLLCTPDPRQWLPNAGVTATRYRGNDRASGQVDAQEISGPLNQQIAQVVAFALRNMQVAARKEPGRVDLPQYSHRALFEALVNAIVHRDYSIRGSKVRLSMFADRLEIQSPGSLPNNLTVESMETRQVTRNEALTSVLARLPVGGIRGSEDRQYFMERRGDGVPIIRRETRELCGKLPEYQVIDDSEVRLTIPAAVQEHSPASAVVTVWSANQPLSGADVLALFPNKTWKRANTNDDGEASVELYTSHLPMTVFAAAPAHAARLEREWTPSHGALTLEMRPLADGGSVIFPEAVGHLPILKGRLNPIRDTSDRTYLYASNIAINQGQPQPVHFAPGEELRLTDADGREALVRILDVVGRSALIEYRRAPRT